MSHPGENATTSSVLMRFFLHTPKLRLAAFAAIAGLLVLWMTVLLSTPIALAQSPPVERPHANPPNGALAIEDRIGKLERPGGEA